MVSLSEEEHASLLARANKQGLALAAYIRWFLMTQRTNVSDR